MDTFQAHHVHHAYRFGEFSLDVERGALLRAGEDVKLRPKSYEVLRYLLVRHGCLVSKEELLDAIWGSTIVTEGSITQCLIDIRRALDDHSQAIIRTVPRRGYLFDAMVVEQDARAGNIDPAAPPEQMPVPWTWRRWWPGAVVVALTVLAAMAVWWIGSHRIGNAPDAVDASIPMPARQPLPGSIAVLPFVDMSPAHDQQHFSDGLSEEILNLLARSPGLRVIARTSSFSFRDQDDDIATVAGKLNVAYVLEGSVRKSDDRIRVTAQLVDTADSTHLWSKTYDREIDDVLVMQDEIAKAVARALDAELVVDGRTTASRVDVRVYERFLQARFFYNRRAAGDIARAEDYYRQALQLDPDHGQAWAGLAAVYRLQAMNGDVPLQRLSAAYRQAVEQALALAPDLGETHMRAAQYYWLHDEPAKARQHLRRAATLQPNDPLVLSWQAEAALMNGKPDQAIARLQQIVALEPLSVVAHGNLAAYLMAEGRYSDAEAELQLVSTLDPQQPIGALLDYGLLLILQDRGREAATLIEQWPASQERDLGLALAYHQLGREADAQAALERLRAVGDAGSAIHLAEAHAWRNEADQAFRWLDAAGRNFADQRWLSMHHSLWWQSRYSPFLRSLHTEPRWDEWLKRSSRPFEDPKSTSGLDDSGV